MNTYEQVTLTIQDQGVDFIVYDKVRYDQKEYIILVAKIIFLDMIASIVDIEALKKSFYVCYRIQNGDRITYIKEEDESVVKDVVDLSLRA